MTPPPSEEDTRSLLAETPEDRARPRLVAMWSGGSASVPLPAAGTLIVGRSAECDLTVGGRAVSREHAALHVYEAGIELEDLKSSNGTRVGGTAIASGAKVPFSRTTWAQLGDAMLVLSSSEDETSPGPAPQIPEESAGPMAAVLHLARLVARGSLGIVIQGETGVGKELLAQYVHDQSPRNEGPFVRLNCAALLESTAESALFGHERGSFTGAHASHAGLLEAAHLGSLFLDEIGELSLGIQAKLLRALGSGEVLRVGASSPRAVDVRIIAASHRRLADLVQSGQFREDLFYRLNGMTLEVPPLRQRREEIVPLAERFLREESQRLGIPTPRLNPRTKESLLAHSWPGNIRELKTCMQRAVLLSEGREVLPDHCTLAASVDSSASAPGGRLDADIKELQKRRVQEALDEAGGNQTRAARLLGISRRALIRRLEEFGFPRPRKGAPRSADESNSGGRGRLT